MSKKKTSRRNAKPRRKNQAAKPQQSTTSPEQKPVERYSSLLVQKRLTEAEKELDQIRAASQSSEWNRGYIKALEGLLAIKRGNNERYSNVSSVDTDPELARSVKRTVRAQLQNQLHADYDKGYFSGLMEYIKLVERLEPWGDSAKTES